MSLCIFFGHGECYGLDKGILRTAIEELINQGVNEFMVGNHGGYDGMVFSCLRELSKEFPGLSYSVILAYLPTHKPEYDLYEGHSLYPEGQEIGPQKFAISRRNQYLIDSGGVGDYCIVYVTHTWGNAYKLARKAKRKGFTVINIGNPNIEL